MTARMKQPATTGRSLADEVRELRALGTNRRVASLALFCKNARQLGPKGPGPSPRHKRAA
jgi:hypothetical protein